MKRHSWSKIIGLSLLFLSTLTFFSPNLSAQSPPAGAPIYITANGQRIRAGQMVPIFTLTPPSLNVDLVTGLAGRFSSLGRGGTVQQEVYNGNTRFLVGNEQTGTVLEQYGATGGFYLYNPSRAFGPNGGGAIDQPQLQQAACNFLNNTGLYLSVEGTIGFPPCIFNPDVFPTPVGTVTLEQMATQSVLHLGQSFSPTTIGAMIRITPFIRTDRFGGPTTPIPLGGPGGHVSLLFRTTDPAQEMFSLDSSVPGLAAVAFPIYARSLHFTRLVPLADMQTLKNNIISQVQASFPNARGVNVPDPVLEYYLGDAAEPQEGLQPNFTFKNIEVTGADGNSQILRDISLPAADSGTGGLTLAVSIQTPANGSAFDPGSAVNLTGAVTGGAGPYHYDWSLGDGAGLAQGDQTVAGSLPEVDAKLPAISHGGTPQDVQVILKVKDSEGTIRQAMISLKPAVAPALYLPLVLRSGPSSAENVLKETASVKEGPLQTNGWRYGVEAGSDYPPYGPGGSDLPGVIPDATGFKTSLTALGWSQAFNWWNNNAWEKDWRDCSFGGIDCTFGVDRADFVYYAGHGGAGGLSLPSSKDSSWFGGDKARFQQAKWVGFASCQTLRVQWPTYPPPAFNWLSAFQGARVLVGFNSNMGDVAFGPRLVDNIRAPFFLWSQRTIIEGWVKTAFDMGAGKPAYIFITGNGTTTSIDRLPPSILQPVLLNPYPISYYTLVWWE